jgi:hypothetical protein
MAAVCRQYCRCGGRGGETQTSGWDDTAGFQSDLTAEEIELRAQARKLSETVVRPYRSASGNDELRTLLVDGDLSRTRICSTGTRTLL